MKIVILRLVRITNINSVISYFRRMTRKSIAYNTCPIAERHDRKLSARPCSSKSRVMTATGETTTCVSELMSSGDERGVLASARVFGASETLGAGKTFAKSAWLQFETSVRFEAPGESEGRSDERDLSPSSSFSLLPSTIQLYQITPVPLECA